MKTIKLTKVNSTNTYMDGGYMAEGDTLEFKEGDILKLEYPDKHTYVMVTAHRKCSECPLKLADYTGICGTHKPFEDGPGICMCESYTERVGSWKAYGFKSIDSALENL